jgi:hypothetical protein
MIRFCLVIILACLAMAAWAAPVCTQTGFSRDGINLTAAMINPVGTVSGEVDATGCNIGVYYNMGQGTVSDANIHGANYYGVVADGTGAAVTVDVLNSSIHDIGESPLNGAQHGVGIYFTAFHGNSVSGRISGNTIWNYQKGGIVVNGPDATADVENNIVQGQGRVDYIAQNGIQAGWGATATILRNTVTGNAYTGTNCASSGGIIAVGGPLYGPPNVYTTGTRIVGNTVVNNDVGVYLSNWDLNGPPSTATNIKAVNNTITNDALTNISGNETSCGDPASGGGYQAGVSDVGNNDKIIDNTISGAGYAASGSVGLIPVYAIPVDASTSFTNRPKVHANK